MKVLVTGGAGYVGSIVTEELIYSGYQVSVLDNLQQGHRSAVIPEAEFIQADFGDNLALEKIFRAGKFDAVMHMAAETVIEFSMSDPRRYFKNNIVNSLVLLDVMLKYDVKSLVFSSSAATYGEPTSIPISEENTKTPVNSYGESKLMFERILAWYGRAYGLKYVAMRYFNAAGASEKLGEDHRPETHLIPNVLKAALFSDKIVSIFGEDYPTKDGSCIRDYVHVRDIAQAHILALKNMNNVAGKAFNLGSGQGYSVKEIVAEARRITGKPINVEIKPRRSGDPAILLASREHATKELKWQPKYTALDIILGSAWKWMQKHPQGYDA
jgi:UDP-glucose 4-epimerase